MTQSASSAAEARAAAPETPGARAASTAGGGLAAACVRGAALWVAFVAAVKLFKGSPNDLPRIVQNFIDIDLGLKFQLVVAIECAVVVLALLRPRWAWPFLVGMFALFVGLLAKMIADGETSCGCFGGAIKVPPVAMLAIDGLCLLAILATRPWSRIAASPVRWGALAPALLAAIALPFVVIDNSSIEVPPRPVDAPGDAPSVSTSGANGASDPGAAQPNDATPADPTASPKAWALPETLPAFQILNPDKQSWEGKALRDTPLGVFLDVDLYPQDATWILYRITCDHCAKELGEIANDPERAAKLYVLVRIPEDDEERLRQVQPHQYPPMFEEAILPKLSRGYVGLTPWAFEVAGGVLQKIVTRPE